MVPCTNLMHRLICLFCGCCAISWGYGVQSMAAAKGYVAHALFTLKVRQCVPVSCRYRWSLMALSLLLRACRKTHLILFSAPGRITMFRSVATASLVRLCLHRLCWRSMRTPAMTRLTRPCREISVVVVPTLGFERP
ncbi:UNVERIFIED_CONTAM: hypothetical protein GTU68_034915 [Idotea baltica]|nr:hypothetical protein [Idotea baltica]